MKENKNVDFNYSECIKEYDKFGETTYINICSKDKTTIPWGVGGWAAATFILLVILLLIGIIAVMIKMIFDF